MVTFTASTSTDNPTLSAGADIVNVTNSNQIQAADTFQGGDGIDTIIVGSKNTTISIDLSTASSNGTAGFLSFEALGFANTGSGTSTQTATFSSAQFGTGKISNALAVSGTTGNNANQAVVVNVVSGTSFSAAGWTFTNWSTNNSIDTITINGAAGNETISGSVQNDLINGNGGNDAISSALGNDTVNAGAGNDSIWSGLGNDTIDGGADIDTVIYSTSAAPVTVTFATATTATATNGTFTDTISNVEAFVLSNNADTFNGGTGNDTVTGGKGADVLNGGDGADTFLIRAGDGVDVINGGTGTDTVKLATATSWLIAPSAIAGWSNVEVLDGSSATGTAYIYGTTGGDTINMSGFTQLINVALDGRGGNDTITGSSGGDTIIGGAGADVLTGNGGADTFVFTGAGQSSRLASDTITDLGSDDIIDLSAIDANVLATATGNQAFSWVGTDAFSKVAGELRFDAGLGAIQGDTDGNGVADLQILVTGYTPTGAEFIL